MPVEELERLKDENVVQLTGVLQSVDGGETWIIVKQDAVVNGTGQALSVNLQGLVLERAKKAEGYSTGGHDELKDLAEQSDATDTATMARLLSHWYGGEDE